MELPGVGRKTANALSVGFGKPGLAVDTHAEGRFPIGVYYRRQPEHTELRLKSLIPLRNGGGPPPFIWHGRSVRSRKPRCQCPLSDLCPAAEISE